MAEKQIPVARVVEADRRIYLWTSEGWYFMTAAAALYGNIIRYVMTDGRPEDACYKVTRTEHGTPTGELRIWSVMVPNPETQPVTVSKCVNCGADVPDDSGLCDACEYRSNFPGARVVKPIKTNAETRLPKTGQQIEAEKQDIRDKMKTGQMDAGEGLKAIGELNKAETREAVRALHTPEFDEFGRKAFAMTRAERNACEHEAKEAQEAEKAEFKRQLPRIQAERHPLLPAAKAVFRLIERLKEAATGDPAVNIAEMPEPEEEALRQAIEAAESDDPFPEGFDARGWAFHDERDKDMHVPTFKDALESPTIHTFCANILESSVDHDPVDVLNDLEFALAVLKKHYRKLNLVR